MSEIKPKTKSIKGCRTFDEILDVEYGTQGTPERDAFEQGAVAFILAERLKEERLKAGLTQEQLAERIGTKKTYISRIENGKADFYSFPYLSGIRETGQIDNFIRRD